MTRAGVGAGPGEDDAGARDRYVFLFPGQGSQTPGMGRRLYESSAAARACIDECGRIAGVDLPAAMFGAATGALRDPLVAQLAVFGHSMATAAVLQQEGIRPAAVAGHSLGEYSALVAAGALDLQQAVRFVGLRGRAMAAASRRRPGAMSAVLRLPAADVEVLCEAAGSSGTVVPANYNAAMQTVVSGEEAAVEHVAQAALRMGGRALRLPVGGAFHSPLMREAEIELAPDVAALPLQPPSVTLVSSMTGRVQGSVEEYRASLTGQVTRPVRWTAVLATLATLSPCVFLEVGPGEVLTRLARSEVPGAPARSLADWEDLVGALEEARR